MKKRFIGLLILLLTLSACATTPESESVSTYSVIYLAESSQAGSITAADLHLDEVQVTRVEAILSNDTIHSRIHERYPDVEYTCNLEKISDTFKYKIVVAGTDGTNLTNICNEITSAFCKEVSTQLPELSIKIVDNAVADQ